jgi:hypothetical protein
MRNFRNLFALRDKTGVSAMRIRITLLAIGFIVSGLLLAIAHQPQGPVPAPKTDRLVGEKAPAGFLPERFAG